MKIKSWSYSSLSAYEQCPHKWMYQRIVKLPEPESYHLNRGNYIHSLAENFLKGKVNDVPSELSKFKSEFINLKKVDSKPEEAIVLRSDWSYLGNEDAWGSDEAWLRLKIDASPSSNYLIDFKTGKKYDTHKTQAKLYSNVKMMLDDSLESVDVELWYLDSEEVVEYSFTRDSLQDDIADWERRIKVMHDDTEFKPRVNEWCKNCYVKQFCNAYE